MKETSVKNCIESFDGNRKKLLLHCCCAPCSTVVFERLNPYFEITAFFCNPNITAYEEYFKRKEELERLADTFGISVIDGGFQPDAFFEKVKGLEEEPEKSARCTVCFDMRLKEAAAQAKKGGFDFFATTITVGPMKDAFVVNQIGNAAGESAGVKYLSSDFKKNDGFKRSAELSKELGLYRQDYCGCVFSKKKAGKTANTSSKTEF